MSDSPTDAAPDSPPRRMHTEAVERRGRWPGIVWAIPLAALLVTAYLGVEALANRGVRVVVTFKSSGGARAGETPVVYKGVTVGHVVHIRIAENARDVDMTLRLEPRAKPHLRRGAQFWLIGAEPTLTDLSSLKAAVSGVSIGVSPGPESGPYQDHFVGLDQPPAVPPDTPGTPFVLEGRWIGSTREGSGVYYHGLQVGRITRVEVRDLQVSRLIVFVNAPYDRLVRAGSLFYNASAAEVSLAAGHVNANLGPGASVLTGGVEFDTPAALAAQPRSRSGTVFRYYATKQEASDPPAEPQVRYRAVFRAASQRPQPDAPVWMSGVRIGRVLASRLTLTPGDAAPATTVELELEPRSLGLTPAGDGRAAMDAALRGLVRGGYRLTLGQQPPLIGTAALSLQPSSGARGALGHGGLGQGGLGQGDEPEIPTAPSAGLDAASAKINKILDKVDEVPIEQIGSNVRAITARLETLVSSPQLSDSLQHLDGALTQADEMMRETKPQVGPLVAKLKGAADQMSAAAAAADAMLSGEGAAQGSSLPEAIAQLNEAARSIRTLADYLGRHPEAVLKGKAPESR